MIHGFDDAAYYLDHAREFCADGDLQRAADAATAARTALESGPSTADTSDATAYARAAADAITEHEPDRAGTYLGLSARAVEELLALDGTVRTGPW